MQSSVKLLAVVIASAWAETQFDVWNFDTAELFQTISQKPWVWAGDDEYYVPDNENTPEEDTSSATSSGYPPKPKFDREKLIKEWHPKASDQSMAYRATTPLGERAVSVFLGSGQQAKRLVERSGFTKAERDNFERLVVLSLVVGLVAVTTGPGFAVLGAAPKVGGAVWGGAKGVMAKTVIEAPVILESLALSTPAVEAAPAVVAAAQGAMASSAPAVTATGPMMAPGSAIAAAGAETGISALVCAFGPAVLRLGAFVGYRTTTGKTIKKPSERIMQSRIGQSATSGPGDEKMSMAIEGDGWEAIEWCIRQSLIQFGQQSGLWTQEQLRQTLAELWEEFANVDVFNKAFKEFETRYNDALKMEDEAFSNPLAKEGLKMIKFVVQEAVKKALQAAAAAHGWSPAHIENMCNLWMDFCTLKELGEDLLAIKAKSDKFPKKGEKGYHRACYDMTVAQMQFGSKLLSKADAWLIRNKVLSVPLATTFLGVSTEAVDFVNKMDKKMAHAVITCLLTDSDLSWEEIFITDPIDAAVKTNSVKVAFITELKLHFGAGLTPQKVKEVLKHMSTSMKMSGLNPKLVKFDEKTVNDFVNAVVDEAGKVEAKELLREHIKDEGP